MKKKISLKEIFFRAGERNAAVHYAGSPKRWLWVLSMVALAFFLKAAAFAWLVTPLWSIPDEAGHYSYIEDLTRGSFPVLGKARMEDDTTISWLGPHATPTLNWIAQHPPLYYVLDTPAVLLARTLGLDFDHQVRSARLLTALFGALTLVGMGLLVTRVTKSPELGLAACIFTAATPMYLHLSSGVTHDTLLMCACTWAVERLSAWLSSNEDKALYLCAAFLGAACITKITALTLALPVVILIVIRLMQSSETTTSKIKKILFVGALAFGPLSVWMARNVVVFGSPLVDARILEPATRRVHIGILEFMVSMPFWQQTFVNYVGMLGWSSNGALRIFQIHGLPLSIFSMAVLLCGFLCLFVLALEKGAAIARVTLLFGLFTSYYLFEHFGQIRFTGFTCLFILIGSISMLIEGARRTHRGENEGLMLLVSSIAVIFFSYLYVSRLWHEYDGALRATQGRYIYPVLSCLTLIMAWPWRSPEMSRFALALAVFMLIVCDFFYFTQVVEFFNSNYSI